MEKPPDWKLSLAIYSRSPFTLCVTRHFLVDGASWSWILGVTLFGSSDVSEEKWSGLYWLPPQSLGQGVRATWSWWSNFDQYNYYRMFQGKGTYCRKLCRFVLPIFHYDDVCSLILADDFRTNNKLNACYYFPRLILLNVITKNNYLKLFVILEIQDNINFFFFFTLSNKFPWRLQTPQLWVSIK